VGEIATAEILEFVQRLGGRYSGSATLLLLGGSALCLLGNPRRTLDIDYLAAGPLDHVAELQATVDTVAAEMKLEVEVVPLGELIPLPDGAESRHRHVGQFGGLTVCVFDPYSIALSKVDRGFEADLQDVVFLIRQGIINLEQLEVYVTAAMPHAAKFDMIPADLRQHLQVIRQMAQQ
jgi:hypothetical protein